MLLTITTTHSPASDLGFLLMKHPDRCQSFSLSFGNAHVFYPEVNEERCTAALLIDIDAVALVRSRKRSRSTPRTLANYVNDRPYVASSFLSVAISQVLGTALGGRSRERQELADSPIPLEVTIDPVPVRGGRPLLDKLFGPLGYEIETTQHPLDPAFPEWGESRYHALTLKGTLRLKDMLSHLYVLIPVLDLDKHYYIDDAEVEKLLDKGEGWLQQHPEREQIARRYLPRRRGLARQAIAQLVQEDGIDPDAEDEAHGRAEEVLEERISLDERRRGVVLSVLREAGARRVIDLGCGEGKLLRALLDHKDFEQIVGVDVSPRVLEVAERRLKLDRMPPMKRQRIQLLQGSLIYRDERFAGFDAACLIEVIEHLDRPRLGHLERVVFECARPQHVLVTTPNREYNALFDGLPEGKLRHADHRFEWTREEFRSWADATAERHGYSVRYLPIGDLHPELGAPTQMGVFSR